MARRAISTITPVATITTAAEAAFATAAETAIAAAAKAAITAAAEATFAASAKSAVATAATKATARLRCWCRAFELELCGHRLAAVLGHVKRYALTFTQRLGSRRCECRYMDEHVGAAAIRQDKSEALRLIEPLYSSSLPHSSPLVPEQVAIVGAERDL
jgi:hypothetical protein